MIIEHTSEPESAAPVPPEPSAPPAKALPEKQAAEEMTPIVESDASVSDEHGSDEPAEQPPEEKSEEQPVEASSEASGTDQSAEEPPPEPPAVAKGDGKPSSNRKWYVVKVQSGREESIRAAIERRVKIEGLEEYFGQVVVPIERITEVRNGKRVVKKRKKFPGYVMAEVEFNDKILYLFRETAGVGDFVGGGGQNRAPIPMSDREVHAMLRDQEGIDEKGELPKLAEPSKIPFNVGDKVRVNNGIFQGLEGEIKEIREPKDASETHRIRVELTVFGRPTSVELEHWQIDEA
jgi:transcriptional antiterminator NusG